MLSLHECMILYMAIGRFFSVRQSSCLNNQYSFYTTAMTSLLVPPASVRGMTYLDRDAFATVVTVSTLKLHDIAISKNIHVLKKYLLKMCNFKSVQKINDGAIVYLNPDIVKKFEDITETDRKVLVDQYEYFSTMNITIKYDNYRRDTILKSILPKDIEVPTAYSLVGHIVQLNLRDIHLPYKFIIGQVFLDKTASARTVVNKINTIDTSFRYFAMEILAGERNTITVAKEHGCTYQFDFAQVYWNPRLSTEHVRMITFMTQGDVLYDVFAGVGPFAIPAARKKIHVFANDLNPESYKWLKKNATVNRLKDNFKTFNMDGRDFLRKVVRDDILARRAQDLPGSEHIIMNLPASAIEFLDILPNWFTQEELKKVCLKSPIFHIYCFVKANKGDDVCMLGKLLIEQKLGYTLSTDSIVNIHDIRDVSPNKQMVRVSFLLKLETVKGEEPAMKKLKISNTSDL
ncbi:tRNA (guanine(37)-N1)-methyltransferase isoform X1 [Temnothorax curvispinosus]|uniref:tRNA (guanine(37)-N1)-methyltransferase n=2 Tax=Temnothorax curvispinosus TaxID=300111 RepID=A0A6J1R1L0_9HYME|nr:tRNA (guanine(37)-N1)-methyltransferase isoform X1 [Temnothorax curvispinosus]XP_024886701.1 tRNA (guanine(37)-N1)-methyltransferase isoform X1 [Temnothorax curvispinosus]